MPRGAQYTVSYHGQSMTLPQLARVTGISYITIIRRWQRGIRDVQALIRPSRNSIPKCTALNVHECLSCPYPDCIRPINDRLIGEDYSQYLR